MQNKEIHILLVEDDAAYRTLVLSILRRAGMKCTMCINGDQAMKKLSQDKYDLIISDYLLPGPNAIELIRWARNNKIGTPALILTNFPSEELQNKIKALSHAELISKSAFDPMSMPKIIQEKIVT
jgi:DNA-binding response OmpR family regulator